MNGYISKSEYQLVFNAVQKVLNTKVEEIELSDKIPTLNFTQDNNKVFRGKLSVLFVDMRKSTDLTDDLKSKKMVKIYRSFIRLIIQAIRYSGGETRQFAGDGIMGVFQDNTDGKITSSEKAVQAARYIITMMDYCLNPLLSKNMDGLSIACGVGICTGNVLVTKVGMRGKEQDDTAENEMGLVWTGKTTNYANRYCSLAGSCEIFIDQTTYQELSDKSVWKGCSRVKENKLFKGFVSYEHYLALDHEITQVPIKCTNMDANTSFVQEIFDETQQKAQDFIDNFLRIYGDKKIEDFSLTKREKQIAERERKLDHLLIRNEADTLYDCITEIADKLTDDQIRVLGKDFFIDRINKLSSLYKKLGQNSWKAYEASQFLSIYRAFGIQYKCYEMLCIMARGEFPIYPYEVKCVANYYDTSELKQLLLDYYYANENEQADYYKECADMLED